MLSRLKAKNKLGHLAVFFASSSVPKFFQSINPKTALKKISQVLKNFWATCCRNGIYYVLLESTRCCGCSLNSSTIYWDFCGKRWKAVENSCKTFASLLNTINASNCSRQNVEKRGQNASFNHQET